MGEPSIDPNTLTMTEADARVLAAALAGVVAPNGHLLWCLGLPPNALYPDGVPCDEEGCVAVRVALAMARARGYLPASKEENHATS